jgi:hypothetical protein
MSDTLMVSMRTGVPTVWVSALKRAQMVDESAVLAGGALRDLRHFVEVKDLDIFVGPYATKELLDAAFGVTGKSKISAGCAYKLGMTDVLAVYEYTLMGCPIIQVIVLREPVTMKFVLERIDFGICQIGFDGEHIVTTSAYAVDHQRQTFTLTFCPDANRYQRAVTRFDRLSQKYPGWQLVLPLEWGLLMEDGQLDLDALSAA